MDHAEGLSLGSGCLMVAVHAERVGDAGTFRGSLMTAAGPGPGMVRALRTAMYGLEAGVGVMGTKGAAKALRHPMYISWCGGWLYLTQFFLHICHHGTIQDMRRLIAFGSAA